MDKSVGDLRTKEFPYLPNSIQPMSALRQTLPIWTDIEFSASTQEHPEVESATVMAGAGRLKFLTVDGDCQEIASLINKRSLI